MKISGFNIKFSQNLANHTIFQNGYYSNSLPDKYFHNYDITSSKSILINNHVGIPDLNKHTASTEFNYPNHNFIFSKNLLVNSHASIPDLHKHIPLVEPTAKFGSLPTIISNFPSIESNVDKLKGPPKSEEDSFVKEFFEEIIGTSLEELFEALFNKSADEDSQGHIYYDTRGLSETFQGGSGHDTLKYSGLESGYEITKIDSSTTIIKNKNSAEIDKLIGIETIKFADNSVDLRSYDNSPTQNISIIGQETNPFSLNTNTDLF